MSSDGGGDRRATRYDHRGRLGSVRFPEDDVLLWTPHVPPPLVLDREMPPLCRPQSAVESLTRRRRRRQPRARPSRAAWEFVPRAARCCPAPVDRRRPRRGCSVTRLRNRFGPPCCLRHQRLLSVPLAIANAANLFLARGLSRRGELQYVPRSVPHRDKTSSSRQPEPRHRNLRRRHRRHSLLDVAVGVAEGRPAELSSAR